MAGATDTQTAIELPAAGQPRIVGVLQIFTNGKALLRPHRVRSRVRVGRDADMEIHLDDSKVSRFHAEILPAPEGVLVTDRASRNGTFVDGVRLERDQVLAPAGSTLRIGRTLLFVVDDIGPHEAADALDDALVGGAALAGVRREIAAVGPSRVSVLIEGETGTGKEVVAQAIHRASARAGELCALNCAAIPGDLVESELFGHTRGAFSGSERERRGLFRSADGGTLLLDEIGDLPAEAQAKLLRVLETGEVRAVGEDRALRVDVRVLAATNRSLEQLVAQGRFRADLFHRVATARLTLPPLRDRRQDVPLLAVRFAGPLEIGLAAMERLVAARFAGNVRELRNAIELGAARARARGSDVIELEDLSLPDPQPEPSNTSPSDDTSDERLIAALEAAGGNVTQAARDLGMRRPTVYERLRRLGRDPTSFRKR